MTNECNWHKTISLCLQEMLFVVFVLPSAQQLHRRLISFPLLLVRVSRSKRKVQQVIQTLFLATCVGSASDEKQSKKQK